MPFSPSTTAPAVHRWSGSVASAFVAYRFASSSTGTVAMVFPSLVIETLTLPNPRASLVMRRIEPSGYVATQN
jgi:hypothetical protein